MTRPAKQPNSQTAKQPNSQTAKQPNTKNDIVIRKIALKFS